MFDSIADITSSSKRMSAVRALCSAAKNGDTCLDLKLLRAVGTCVFRQLFAQLSSEVAHFTHLYFEATSRLTILPNLCILQSSFLDFERQLLPARSASTGVLEEREASAFNRRFL